MKFLRTLQTGLGLLGFAGALATTNMARADFGYYVSLDTSSLLGSASGPFYLDFQSIFGSGAAQTITLSGFSFTGGGPVDGTDFSTGAITGSLAGSLVLNPNAGSFYNEFYQQFDASVTDIAFNVLVTSNVAGLTPTSFSVAILDKDLFNIPTTGLGDSLLLVNINGASTNITTSSSIGTTSGVGATVPEAATTLVLLAGVLLALGATRHVACSRRSSAA